MAKRGMHGAEVLNIEMDVKTEKEEQVITKEQLGDDWQPFEDFAEGYSSLVEKIHRYSTLTLTTSLGVLGFFFLFLLRVKTSSDSIYNKYLAGFIILVLFISIALGFYIRIRHELVKGFGEIIRYLKPIVDSLLVAEKDFIKKGSKLDDTERLLEYKSKSEDIEKGIKTVLIKAPYKLIITQTLTFVFSTIVLVAYIISFLFFH